MPKKPQPKAKSLPKFQILNEATVPLSRLKPDPQNANIHDEENLAAIQASFETFGQVERLVVRKSDDVVFAGNGRVEVMQRLGSPKARVQYVEGSDEQCRAYAIASNQTTRMSRFDNELLATQLTELQDVGLLEAAAFQPESLDALLKDLEPAEKNEPEGKGPEGSRANLTVSCPKCGHDFKVGGKQ